MKKTISFLAAMFFCVAASSATDFRATRKAILEDSSMDTVREMAHEIISKGLNAGDGYGEVWIRDFNTFITTAMDVMPDEKIRESLDIFFHFQGEDGNIVDGYLPISKADLDNPDGYRYRLSATAPQYAAHKNTVETDHETSLIQAVYQYVKKSGNTGYLQSVINGRSVEERLEMALDFLMEHKMDSRYGLITGATTADWGDVQPEHAWGVEIDGNTHYTIDIYDNAMLVLALEDYMELISDPAKKEKWAKVKDSISDNVRRYLWDGKNRKFIPHIYLNGSPFPADFDENQIYYHGGTAVAALAGLLSKEEVGEANSRMLENVRKAGAQTIGLTMYPTYPAGYFKGVGMYPYGYQNGGDWTWFGARMIWALIEYGYISEAYNEIRPMLERVIRNRGFNEWYTQSGEPKGSGTFRGEAGVLVTAIDMLREWAGSYEAVPVAEARNSTVLFTFGQSNSANHGQGTYEPETPVFNYAGGHLYPASDPLIGASGYGSGPWCRLADLMNREGLSEKVTLISVGQGSTTAADWAEGGRFHEKLVSAVESALCDSISIDYILWHQGESDNLAGTSSEEYINDFLSIREVFRSRGIDAPIIIATATYHPGADASEGCLSPEIRKAQKQLVKEYYDIFAGPDTDRLDRAIHRADGVHFSAYGQDLHAAGWLKAVRKAK